MNIQSWETKSKRLKSEIHALYLAYKHPRTPWYAKAFAVLILGYAPSPIDLIPDFIPVVGYLDDLVIVPAGIALLMKMIPKDVLQECREKAQAHPFDGIMFGKKSAVWNLSLEAFSAMAMTNLLRPLASLTPEQMRRNLPYLVVDFS
jgi:uncharacterized membrane protein YkvA (DUF1232 family)